MPDINLTADEIDAAEEVFGPLTVAQMHWLEEFARAHRDEALTQESLAAVSGTRHGGLL